METRFKELRGRYEEIAAFSGAAALLDWDQRTYMPPKGAAARGRTAAALRRAAHQKLTDPGMGRLIADLYDWAQGRGYDSFEASYLRALKREYDKAAKLPPEFVSEFALAKTAAYEAWHKAKTSSDFRVFAPHLEKMVELNLRKASILAPGTQPYDTLLDNFDPGLTRARLDPLFSGLLEGLRPVMKGVAAAPDKVSDAVFRQDFDEKAQLRLADELVKALGFDFARGRQDTSAHPFTTGSGRDDVRITTWTMRNWLPACVYASLHECGHALYHLGTPSGFEMTPLAGGAGLGMHESQSRYWENIVGRSRSFARWVLPLYRKHFPDRFARVGEEELYRAANRSEASLIRVEADEVTYSFHIILRYELETMLLDRELKVKDAPELWNAKMKEYLGITPANDAEGILQDVHWSYGMLGYFPTYVVGNLISAQLQEAMTGDLGDTGGLVERGEFAPILAWMREKVHAHGRKYEPEELLQKSIGQKLQVGPFVKYITTKYSELYGF